MPVFRAPGNPILEPKDIKPSRDDFEVIGVFNAGAARLDDEVILLLRVAERHVGSHPDIVLAPVYDVQAGDIAFKEFARNDPQVDFSDPRLIVANGRTYLTSISHLRVARSTDGQNFRVDDSPALSAATEYETFGLEDPRITRIGDDYYIDYVAVSPVGITTALACTRDFKTFERRGVIFCPDNKDVALFGEQVKGKYYALHRPVSPLFGKQDIWISESPDLLCWGNHRHVMGPRPGTWDGLKIGAGAPPVKTEKGWLEIYHGADENNRYCLGGVLLDLQQPWKVIARTEGPILEPEADYETKGFFGNVVFSSGLLCEEGLLKIYYGVADTSVAYAELPLEEVLDSLS